MEIDSYPLEPGEYGRRFVSQWISLELLFEEDR